MKKILSLLMIGALTVSMISGCGKDNKDNEVGKPNVEEPGNTTVDGVDPEDYRGTTITYVTWKDPALNEDGPVIEAFEEKYGINVEIQLVDQENYINIIAGDIAAGTQGDICFVNESFPASLTVMQPLDAAQLDLTDPIWDPVILKDSTIDGHTYLLNTVSNIWSEVDVCVYNKRLFEENGIKSPAEYYEEGNWTLAAFEKCCREIAALGEDYLGADVLGRPFVGGIDAAFFTFDGDEFKVSVDERLYDGMQFLSKLYADGLINPGTAKFENEKTGMAITNAFAMKRTGYFSTMNPDHIGATYLPKYDENSEHVTSGIYRGWGLIKGAKNPVAAGIFLRYYLDASNYDLDLTFHSEDLANFFFEVTGPANTQKKYYHTCGLRMLCGYYSDEYKDTDFEERYDMSPSQIRAWIESQLPLMENMAQAGTDAVQAAKAEIAETYGTSE